MILNAITMSRISQNVIIPVSDLIEMKVVFIRSPRLAIFPPILYDNVCSAGMAELADALASGASDRKVMQVQVLFPAPKRDRDFISRSLFKMY